MRRTKPGNKMENEKLDEIGEEEEEEEEASTRSSSRTTGSSFTEPAEARSFRRPQAKQAKQDPMAC